MEPVTPCPPYLILLPLLRGLLSFPSPCQCFAVRSLGWVEVPEEDLVPGKSSIAVNNCIQQLAQTRSRSQPPDGAWGEVSWLTLRGIKPSIQQRWLSLNCLCPMPATFI